MIKNIYKKENGERKKIICIARALNLLNEQKENGYLLNCQSTMMKEGKKYFDLADIFNIFLSTHYVRVIKNLELKL